MKALVCKGKDAELVLEQVAKPIPLAGETLLKVYYSALNHRDVWIQKGQYAGLQYPIILGSDMSGMVAVGTDVGQKVIVNPGMNWPGQARQQPEDFEILGLPKSGTMAEYIAVPTANIHKLPAHLSMAQGAALPLAGLTAYRALFTKGGAKAGDKVLITGIGGGVALFALQFAVASGCHTFVTSSKEGKLAQAEAMGASGGQLYSADAWEKDLLKKVGTGFDIVIDGAAGENMGKLVDLCAPGGRIVLYGGTAGKWPAIVPQKIFWKQLTILGTTMGCNEEFEAMLAFVSQHRIVPKEDKIFEMEDGEHAMRWLDAGGQMGKVLIEINKE